MRPGEKWWGLCNGFGREMPFTEKSDFKCDLRADNYGHQSLSFLCSDKGRAIWCAEPVGVKIAVGETRLGWTTISLTSHDATGFGDKGRAARILLAATGLCHNGGAKFTDHGDGTRLTSSEQF